MATSVPKNEFDDLSKKIDAALDLWDKRNVVSFQAMLDVFMSKRESIKIVDVIDVNHIIADIISDFVGPCGKSKFVTGKKFLEAFLFSNTFEESEFENIQQYERVELVWVIDKDGNNLYLVLVSQNEIIYSIPKPALDVIRRLVQSIWPVLKDRVRNNLFDSLRTSEPVPDKGEIAASSQASFDSVASNNSTSDGLNIQYPLTDDVKKVMLDEVNSLNLDPRMKQQFVFDMKVLRDKSMLYWRDRVDCLRFSSSNTVINTAEKAAVADPATPVQVIEEEADAKLQVENISNLPETVNRTENYLVQFLSGTRNADSSIASSPERIRPDSPSTISEEELNVSCEARFGFTEIDNSYIIR